MLGFRVIYDHASLGKNDGCGLFVFDLVVFNPIDDYDGVVGEILNALEVSLRWPKAKALMIMQGLLFF